MVDYNEVVNTYIRYAECLSLFLQAENEKYAQLCLVNADMVLGLMANGLANDCVLPPTFHEICDKIYSETLFPHSKFLSDGSTQLLFDVRARRKSMGTDRPLPSAVNPWGMMINRNRV